MPEAEVMRKIMSPEVREHSRKDSAATAPLSQLCLLRQYVRSPSAHKICLRKSNIKQQVETFPTMVYDIQNINGCSNMEALKPVLPDKQRRIGNATEDADTVNTKAREVQTTVKTGSVGAMCRRLSNSMMETPPSSLLHQQHISFLPNKRAWLTKSREAVCQKVCTSKLPKRSSRQNLMALVRVTSEPMLDALLNDGDEPQQICPPQRRSSDPSIGLSLACILSLENTTPPYDGDVDGGADEEAPREMDQIRVYL